MSENKKIIIQEARNNHFNVQDSYRHLNEEELRAICDQDRLPISVCLLNVTGDLNVGVSIRTALNLGARRVFVIGNKKYDKRSTVGAHNYIDIIKVKATGKFDDTIDSGIFHETMTTYNMYPVAVEQGGVDIRTFFETANFSLALEKAGPDRELCFVFGNEGMGIPIDILNDIKEVVSIPQLGVLRSYNVSTAVAIAMWELGRKYV